MANLTIQGSNRSLQPTQRNGINVLTEDFQGNFGVNVAEQTVAIIESWPYRSFDFTLIASAWGTATVTIKVYPCDQWGRTDSTNTNAFFAIALTAAATVRIFLSEMGGAVTASTYPATAATTGSVIGPFGNYIKITETETAFASGTNTVQVRVEAKG